MCRPKSQGGRRCPSHSDPILIAARNARRRENYHASKVVLLANQTSEEATGQKISHAASVQSFRDSGKAFFSKKLNGKKIANMYKPKGLTQASQKINIKSSENEGYLVEKEYFSNKNVEGVINYNNLDENSYKEFGFKSMEGGYRNTRSQKTDDSEIMNLSKNEVKDLTKDEKFSLQFFTSNQFNWFNKALYSGDLDGDESKGEHRLFETSSTDYGAGTVPYQSQNKATVRYITDKMDSALAKGPGVQRIVYRGISKNSPIFEDNVSQWIDSNAKLGQEITFDGYQSASHVNNTAANYAGKGGLVYEILTPEGVNVTSLSDYTWESEITLPRQSRYMVVGVHKDVPTTTSVLNPNVTNTRNIIQLVAINDKGEVLTGQNETAKTDPFDSKEIK